MSRFLFIVLVLPACGSLSAPADPMLGGEGQGRAAYDAHEERIILTVANTATLEVLDFDVPLDVRAARGIATQRPFDDLDALDRVPYVGPFALDRLLSYGLDHLPAEEVYDCSSPSVYDGEGQRYPYLAEAQRRTQSDELFLCPGSHRVTADGLRRSAGLTGIGDGVVLDIGDRLELPGTHRFTGVTFDGGEIRVNNTAEVVFSDAHFDDLDLYFREASVEVHRSHFSVGEISIAGGETTFVDCIFVDAPEDYSAVFVTGGDRIYGTLEKTLATVHFDGGAFYRNGAGVIQHDTASEISFDDVDFGWEEDDNRFDVRTGAGVFGTSYDWLRDGVSGSCIAYACSFQR